MESLIRGMASTIAEREDSVLVPDVTGQLLHRIELVSLIIMIFPMNNKTSTHERN